MTPQLTKLVTDFSKNLSTIIEQESRRKTSETLQQIVRGLPGLAPVATTGKPKTKQASRASRLISAKHRAAMRLQGQYIGALRTLNASETKRVKAEREKNGHASAIALANKIKASHAKS